MEKQCISALNVSFGLRFDLLNKYKHKQGTDDGELSFFGALVDMGNSDLKAGVAVLVYLGVQNNAVINKEQFVVNITDQRKF